MSGVICVKKKDSSKSDREGVPDDSNTLQTRALTKRHESWRWPLWKPLKGAAK